MDKKTIKLKYIDHDSTVKTQQNGPFYDILAQRYNIEFSDEPDYVIYGPFGNEHLKFFNAVKIFWTGECIAPDFNECDYAIGYDYIDFQDRYLRYPLWLKYGHEQNERMENKHLKVKPEALDRSFCSFVVSNDFADPMRDKLFDALNEYKKVDSGGRYRNNINHPEGVEDKLKFQSEHKFALACENCSHPGYTTEKLMEAFEAGVVPIYWGDPKVTEEFNSYSFIDCGQFSTVEDIVNEVKRIDADDEAYLKMLYAPALNNKEHSINIRQEKLEKFLYNIFDQTKENAYRRNMQCWGKKYNDILLGQKQAFETLQKPKKIIKKLIGK